MKQKTKLRPELITYLNQLQKDKTTLSIDDLGAGSKKFSAHQRKVNKIHKISSSPQKNLSLFKGIIDHYPISNVLELGTCLGATSLTIALEKEKIQSIDTIEGAQALYTFTKKKFEQLKIENTNFHCGAFIDQLPEIVKQGKIYDLIFIDGHHDGEATLEYLAILSSVIHDNTFVILDDINWSISMTEAWKKIVKNEQFHVTIDLFRMGILIKRPQQTKEHFIIKH